MSNELTLFGKPNNAALALLSGLEDNLTNTLAGGAQGGNKRISIEGGAFREFVGGKEVRVSEERSMKVILINAAPVSRMFFEGTYVKGQKTKPTCWSSDTQTPDSAVPQDQRQAKFCKDCKQHIKGSGQGDTRACRFQQRIAVALDGDLRNESVYQITLPSTSVFGDTEGGGKKMPLQAYGRHLKAYNTPAISIVTEMRFDIDSATPKLVFSPVRALEEDELEMAVKLQNHPDTIKAITLNVSQMDGVIAAPKLFDEPTEEPASAPVAKAAPKVAKIEAEEVPEPIKVTKKSAPAVEPKSELSDIVGDWDD